MSILTRGCSASAVCARSRRRAPPCGSGSGWRRRRPAGADCVAAPGVAGAVVRRARRGGAGGRRMQVLEQRTESRSGCRPRARSRAEGCAVPSRAWLAGADVPGSASAVAGARARNRIVAAAAPGMAAQQPAQRETETVQRSVPLDRFGRVIRAARQKAAGRRQQRRQQAAGRRGSPARNARPSGAPRGYARDVISPLLAARSAGAAPSALSCRPAAAPPRDRRRVRIGPLAGAGAGDQHIIGPRPPARGSTSAAAARNRRFARLRDHRIADLAARGEADPIRPLVRPLSVAAPPAAPTPAHRPARGVRRRHEENRRGSSALQARCLDRRSRRRAGGRIRRLRRTGACGPSPGARRAPGDRPEWPSAHESRGGACG